MASQSEQLYFLTSESVLIKRKEQNVALEYYLKRTLTGIVLIDIQFLDSDLGCDLYFYQGFYLGDGPDSRLDCVLQWFRSCPR